jgi:hypothetical protein
VQLFSFLCLVCIFSSLVETDAYRVCAIRGTTEGAQLAESLIHNIILNQPLIESYEMFVPQVCSNIHS